MTTRKTTDGQRDPETTDEWLDEISDRLDYAVTCEDVGEAVGHLALAAASMLEVLRELRLLLPPAAADEPSGAPRSSDTP